MAEYETNRFELIEVAIESDPISLSVMEMMNRTEGAKELTGTPTALLKELAGYVPKNGANKEGLPQAPNIFTNRLRRVQTFLRAKGVEVEHSKFTLNDYEQEGLEPNVPPLVEWIDTFKRLVDRIGRKKVIWRFDPLVLTDTIDQERLIEKIGSLMKAMAGSTEKMVFSFLHPAAYKKAERKLKKVGINAKGFSDEAKTYVADTTSKFNHSNIIIPRTVDRWMRLLVVTPDIHRVHHSVNVRETNSNYGFNLSWWNRRFGTYKDRPEKGHEDMVIRLAQFRDPQKLSLWHILVMPFVGDPGRVPINRH